MSRSRPMRIGLLPSVLLAGLLGFAGVPGSMVLPANAQGVHASSLASLVLSASDVQHAFGSGFKLLISHETKNAELRTAVTGNTSAAQLQGLTGRVTGYISMYSHQLISFKGSHVSSKPGVTLVLAGVNQYQNADYARRTLTTALHSKVKLPKGTTEQVAPLSGVGDAAVMLSIHTTTPGIPVTDSVYVGFERGKYTAIVDVAAYGGKPNSGTVVSLARLLDARIRIKG